MRFEKKGKLSMRFIGPYEILACIGHVAYRLALPPTLAGVHDVFHVSMLRKYIPDLAHVLSQKLPELAEDMTYEEKPVEILEHKEYHLGNHTIPYVKVHWSNHSKQEASLEFESKLRTKHPHLFGLSGIAPIGTHSHPPHVDEHP
ncbi:uncharacterized protein LOC122655504 [Telopea speciosissima]|uniref:uncharacterized protein LOC122655504 n=1 Tax=Telopea speciosissima TaxID=54955 RepID=UPI001CC3E16C|nr:uncharacterized protein LOC122655504 [Telopea speciosissima]